MFRLHAAGRATCSYFASNTATCLYVRVLNFLAGPPRPFPDIHEGERRRAEVAFVPCASAVTCPFSPRGGCRRRRVRWRRFSFRWR